MPEGGAVRFKAESPERGLDPTDPWADHSRYFSGGPDGSSSESLRSLGYIVSGHPEELSSHDLLADHRHRREGGNKFGPRFVDPEADREPQWLPGLP